MSACLVNNIQVEMSWSEFVAMEIKMTIKNIGSKVSNHTITQIWSRALQYLNGIFHYNIVSPDSNNEIFFFEAVAILLHCSNKHGLNFCCSGKKHFTVDVKCAIVFANIWRGKYENMPSSISFFFLIIH